MIRLATALAILLSAPLLHAADPADPADIVSRADAYRATLESFVVDVELTSYRGTKRQATSTVRVYGKGPERSVVEFLAPAGDKGRRLLMLKDAMWIYMPSASRPIRISPLQRLMGEASNGDIARSNFSVDYKALSATAAELDGTRVWVIELLAHDPGTAYSRVRLFVDATTNEPRRADLFAASGKLLKSAHYRTFGELAGRRIVTEIEIEDQLREGHRTVMRYSNLKPRVNPDRMFARDTFGQ